MKKFTKVFAILMAAVITLAAVTVFAGEAKADGPTYNWQVGNVLAADQPWDMGLHKFADLLNEYSDGRITLTVQSGGSLGSEIEMLESVQMGTLEMSIASTPSLSGFTDVMNYFDLPYLFQSKLQKFLRRLHCFYPF